MFSSRALFFALLFAASSLSAQVGGAIQNPGAGGGGSGSGGGGIVVYSSGAALTPAGTQFIAVGGGGQASTTETDVQIGAPANATVSAMYVNLDLPPGMGNSVAFTWRKAGADQTLTCTVSNTADTCHDTTHTFTVVAGDLINIKLVSTGTILVAPGLTIATQFGTTGFSIENNGTPQPPQPILNLIDGTNTALVCTNNSGNTSTDCKVNASGGGGGGFIQPLTAPVAANFTQLNFSTGAATTTQSNNTSPVTSISLVQQDPNNEDNFAILAKSTIASTFTVSIGVTLASIRNPALSGLVLMDGGTNIIIFGYQAVANGLSFYTYNSFTSFGGSITSNYNPQPMPFGPLIWLRIQETASARNYYTSADGVLWMLQFTESNTAHFTTTRYGVGVNIGGGGGAAAMGWYSFTETNP